MNFKYKKKKKMTTVKSSEAHEKRQQKLKRDRQISNLFNNWQWESPNTMSDTYH